MSVVRLEKLWTYPLSCKNNPILYPNSKMENGPFCLAPKDSIKFLKNLKKILTVYTS